MLPCRQRIRWWPKCRLRRTPSWPRRGTRSQCFVCLAEPADGLKGTRGGKQCTCTQYSMIFWVTMGRLSSGCHTMAWPDYCAQSLLLLVQPDALCAVGSWPCHEQLLCRPRHVCYKHNGSVPATYRQTYARCAKGTYPDLASPDAASCLSWVSCDSGPCSDGHHAPPA